MSSVSFNFAGLRSFRLAVRAANVAATKAMAEEIGKEADRLVPVDTGRLKRSQHIVRRGEGRGRAQWWVIYRAPYAAAVHVLHNPWLRRAAMNVQNARNAAVDAYRRALRARLRNA